MGVLHPYSVPQVPLVACCAICGGNHAAQTCYLLNSGNQVLQPNVEQVDLIGYSRPQSQGQGYGNYHQQGRDQFVPSWNNQGNQVRNNPPGFQDMQTFMNTMMAQMGKLQAEIESLKAQQQGGSNQFSNQASSSNGRLPTSTENPWHQVNAVTTRSGLALKDPPLPSNDPVPERTDKKDEGIQVEHVLDDSEEEPMVQRDSAKGKAHVPDESAPSKKHERKNKKIPSYKKFLKNILGNKKKPEKSAMVDLSEGALTCAILQHKLPPKLKDLGSFAIPCIIGGFVVGGAMCDLGASVSLMPYSLLLYTGDFVVLDIEEDAKVPIILGRPFLATAGALIDVRRGKLVMEVAENKIEFDIFKMAKHQPSYVDECYLIEGLGECTDERRKIELGDFHVSPIDPEPPEKSSVLKRKKKFFGPDGFYKRWMRELSKFKRPPDRILHNPT
ncbi:uncharacterized protein LOC116010969 [Ipomoea triloba]|uniref:uncharacterized protein LOC116010969 n=1 Tax=Ipomoea triloba TaxID=35885 RepID=UPI00125DF553|nr:uncharacterized protein LOC116010969 [Ipomoea triloba]